MADTKNEAKRSKSENELTEFQKLTDPAERKKYWKEHPSIQALYSESNFH